MAESLAPQQRLHENSVVYRVRCTAHIGHLSAKSAHNIHGGCLRFRRFPLAALRVAELLKHAVYADPENARAKALLATSFDQMGYMAESAPWRNFYLTGALELRQGGYAEGFQRTAFLDMLKHTPTERFLEAMAAALNSPWQQ